MSVLHALWGIRFHAASRFLLAMAGTEYSNSDRAKSPYPARGRCSPVFKKSAIKLAANCPIGNGAPLKVRNASRSRNSLSWSHVRSSAASFTAVVVLVFVTYTATFPDETRASTFAVDLFFFVQTTTPDVPGSAGTWDQSGGMVAKTALPPIGGVTLGERC